MLTLFDVSLLIVSLAGYVFLFLKLRAAEARSVEGRERLERVLAIVERAAAGAGATAVADETATRTAVAAEDARDQIVVLRADTAALRALQQRGFSGVEERLAALATEFSAAQEGLEASRRALEAAAVEMRGSAATRAHAASAEAAAAATDAELARKRLRMFP